MADNPAAVAAMSVAINSVNKALQSPLNIRLINDSPATMKHAINACANVQSARIIKSFQFMLSSYIKYFLNEIDNNLQ